MIFFVVNAIINIATNTYKCKKISTIIEENNMSLKVQTLNKLAEHLYKNVAFESPDVWVGLLTGSVELTSEAANGYARASLSDIMGAADGGVCTNNEPLEFPVSTNAWGEVDAVGLYDGYDSEATLLQEIELPSVLNVGANTIVRFPIESIVLGFGHEEGE
jgi:hypothetical protein